MLLIEPTSADPATVVIDDDDPVGITIKEFENMIQGLKPCGCGVISVEPSIVHPNGHKVVRCGQHRGVRTYGA